MEKMMHFLETSLLPAVAGLLKVNENMAKHQSEEHTDLLNAMDSETKQTEELKKAMSVLLESIEALSKPITKLVESVNESNRLQAEQNRLLKAVESSLEENTARLDTMNIAVAAQTEDPGIHAIYEALEHKGRA